MRSHSSSTIKKGFHRPIRAKLIFNPGSGQPGESPQQLISILAEMQKRKILTEIYITTPESRLEDIVRGAIKSGIKLIVVAGGDGTIDSVVGAMVGKDVVLGIIPTGTRNNVAFNLGITGDIANSVALLREGRHLKIDVGRVHCGHSRHWFLEMAALGLLSDLYPIADELQHGDLAQIGGLLSTLVSATPSNFKINLDEKKHLSATTHMMIIANMSYIGPHFQISPDVSFKDSFLDVFTFSDMTKVNMVSHVLLSRGSIMEDAGNEHFRAKQIKIASKPQMSVHADGVLLGQGPISVYIHPRALNVMAGTHLTGEPATTAAIDRELATDE